MIVGEIQIDEEFVAAIQKVKAMIITMMRFKEVSWKRGSPNNSPKDDISK